MLTQRLQEWHLILEQEITMGSLPILTLSCAGMLWLGLLEYCDLDLKKEQNKLRKARHFMNAFFSITNESFKMVKKLKYQQSSSKFNEMYKVLCEKINDVQKEEADELLEETSEQDNGTTSQKKKHSKSKYKSPFGKLVWKTLVDNYIDKYRMAKTTD
jgi:hypothetical protein